jgi:hypothetical protein
MATERIRAIFLKHRTKRQEKNRLDIIIQKIQKRSNAAGKAINQLFDIAKIFVLDKSLNKCKELEWPVLILRSRERCLICERVS